MNKAGELSCSLWPSFPSEFKPLGQNEAASEVSSPPEAPGAVKQAMGVWFRNWRKKQASNNWFVTVNTGY